jgi:hypothetical protein
MHALTTARRLVVVVAAALTGSCSSASGFCQAAADCEREIFGVVVPDQAGSADDSVNVCTVEMDGQVRALRANEEAECQEAADKLEVFMACISAAFAEEKDGCDVFDNECEDELDDFQDALADIDGGECGSNED